MEAVFREHRQHLWALCYRMTGSAADADDLVQDTFARAIERPPPSTDRPWRPWLVRVAINLALDLLRRRKRRGYTGPWLPAVIDTGDQASPPSYEPTLADGSTTAGRYDLLESVSIAFLLALEALTPAQRAVLLLRDVFDYSGRETGEALAMSEAAVKTTLHRARRAMAAYDGDRRVPTAALQQRTRAALEQFVMRLIAGDVAGVEALLAGDVRALSDGGGEFKAARSPLRGRAKVAKFYVSITGLRPAGSAAELRMLNGMPTLVVRSPQATGGIAPLVALQVAIDDQGLITHVHSLLATAKVARLTA